MYIFSIKAKASKGIMAYYYSKESNTEHSVCKGSILSNVQSCYNWNSNRKMSLITVSTTHLNIPESSYLCFATLY